MSNKIKSTEQAQHTPAPWKADSSSIEAIFMGEKLQVASMSRTTFCGYLTETERAIKKAFQATQEADTRLIAAAPELLSACEGLFDVIEARVRNAEINDWKEKLQAGRDAIRKAKGTQ